nr:hypothetical protein GCM10020093_059220 [Planobispora longispora]
MRVLTLNMLYGRAEPAAVMDLLKRLKPDVLSAQELTPEMVEALDAAGIDELLPYRVLQDEPDARGSGLYGRYPMTPLENLFRPVGHNMPAAVITLPAPSPSRSSTCTPTRRWATWCTTGRPPSTPSPPRPATGSASSPETSTPVSTTR